LTSTSYNSQALALAGVLQCTYLVDQLARTGSAPIESVNPSINSLFRFDADSVELVYGGLQGVKTGLQLVCDVLSGHHRNEYQAVVRYAMGVLFLQKKLSANQELLAILRNRLEHTALKAEHFSDDSHSVNASLAAIYQDTAGTFKFRIQVNGSMQQLQNPQNADAIRALLLAAIRSAVLWRQTGGKRWHFISRRSALRRAAQDLLKSF
jgi:high frequency lysogenization protein